MPELVEHEVAGRAGTEAVDADRVVGLASPSRTCCAASTESTGTPGGSRSSRNAPVLVLEAVPARQAHDPGGDAGARRAARRRATHTATSLPVPTSTTSAIRGVDDDAGARARRPTRRSSTSMFWRLRISAVGPSCSTTSRPRVDRLVGVGGPDHVQAGDRPQRGELLDRLVRRAVLADADRVVGEHEADLRLGQRRRAGSAGLM